MRSRRSVGYWVGVAITCAGSVAAAGFLLQMASLERELSRADEVEPFRGEVELSREGEYRVPLNETHQVCRRHLLLGVTPPFRDAAEMTAALRDLGAVVRILDASGRVVDSVELTGAQGYRLGERCVLETMRTQPVGRYEMVVEVKRAAEGLRGRRQVVYGAYELCGFEALPGIFALGRAAGCGVVALIGGAIWLGSARWARAGEG